MSLNWREIDLVLSELELAGSHIQRIVQPDFSSLVLELYRPGDPFALYISLASGKTRLHRLSHPIEHPEKLQRFAQFLRARVKGAKILEATQVGQDRIVRLRVASAGEETLLWVRLWSGAANIIATDAGGRILDAYYRRPARGEVTGGIYNPSALLPAEADSNTEAPPAATTESPLPSRDLARLESRARYQIRDLPGEGSFGERVERFYGQGGALGDLASLRAQALKALEGRETRIEAVRAALARQRADYEHHEQLKAQGDLVIANLHRIQSGDRWLTVEDFGGGGDQIEVPLDPKLSPEKNAESFYERYKKAKSGLARLDVEIAEHDRLLEELARERRLLSESEDSVWVASYLKRIRKEQPERQKQEKRERPGLEYRSGPFLILVGRSAAENDALLRRHVRGNDWWLHSRDYPGAYIFIKAIPGKSIPLEVLLDAGNLALYYSKAKSGGQAELYYTQVKYLRRPREGKLGLVLPTHEKNLSIKLDTGRLDRLFNARELHAGP